MATQAKNPIPPGHHTVTPALTLQNCAQSVEWYKNALGAEEIGTRATDDDGKVMHAEIRIGNSLIMVNDAMMDGKSAKSYGGSPAALWVYVEDADALFNRAAPAEMKRRQDEFMKNFAPQPTR